MIIDFVLRGSRGENIPSFCPVLSTAARKKLTLKEAGKAHFQSACILLYVFQTRAFFSSDLTTHEPIYWKSLTCTSDQKGIFFNAVGHEVGFRAKQSLVQLCQQLNKLETASSEFEVVLGTKTISAKSKYVIIFAGHASDSQV